MKFKSVIEQLSRVKYLNRWVIFLSDLTLAVCSTGIALLFIYSVFDIHFDKGMVALILLISGGGQRGQHRLLPNI